MSARGMELVLLEWVDIEAHAGWKSVREARDARPVRCRDVGWILHRDESRLVLVRSRNASGDVGDVAVFPAGCIVRVTPLAPVARKPKEPEPQS